MKAMSLKNNHIKAKQVARSPIEHDCRWHIEEHFHEMLSLERKRSERSGKPLLLLLFDIVRFGDMAEKKDVGEGIAQILFSQTRETDIKGWYLEDAVLGVIFTEINGTDKEALLRKVQGNLRTLLPEKHVQKIIFSCHAFPGGNDNRELKMPADLTLYPDLTKNKRSRRAELLMKRTMDVVGGIVGIIIFSPLFFLIPLCIKLTSPGPIFFRQERIGQYGHPFTFLKFRTMFIGNDPEVHKEYIKNYIAGKAYSEEDGNGGEKKVYKITKDRRVTLVGKILRKTSLDELPQFFNVLKGDMSLVGPRPPIPYEIENYDAWHRRRVIEIKPGITGLWQVKGRSSTTFDEMVRLDLQYGREWSLWLDIKILLQTPKAVLAGKGAY